MPDSGVQEGKCLNLMPFVQGRHVGLILSTPQPYRIINC